MGLTGVIEVAGGVVGVGAAAAGAWTYAALSAGSQWFGPVVVAGGDVNQVALTFDDGPNDAVAGTAALLDLLAAHRARATFFMIGGHVRQRPELARRVHAAGHLIGNHTETHPWLHFASERRVREELRACNEAIEDVIGAPVRYFRPPHGARNPAVLRVAREMGMATVQWNVMAKDWQPIGVAGMLGNVERGLERCRRRGEGANVLLHDGSDRAMGVERAESLAVAEILLQGMAVAGMSAVGVDAWVGEENAKTPRR